MPNEYGHFQAKSHGISNLALADCVVRFRLFASVFEHCQRNDTRNDTRPKRLRERLIRVSQRQALLIDRSRWAARGGAVFDNDAFTRLDRLGLSRLS